MAVISTLAGILAGMGIGGAVVTTGIAAGTVVATTLSYVVATALVITLYGGVALLASSLASKAFHANSPTYQSILQTQTNPDLPVPLLYGTVKLAGNRIWQNDPSEKQIKRIIAFAEGEITDFTDIRLNDIPIKDVPGNKVEKFLGTNDQGLPSMVRLDTVGSLRNVAYLAITCNKTNKVDINYNLTTVVKGRKIRVYTTPTQYVVKYSENPSWVLFDFLTSYNGLGIALDNNGNISNSLITQLFDLETFIESAAFCDQQVTTNGKNTPRFSFNMIFDSQTSARDLIDEIKRNCRGGLFTKNGKLQFKIDKAEPVSQVFTAQDIIKGSETFSVIPKEEHYDILRCTYVSPDHEWQKVEAFAEIPEYRDGVPIEHSINLYSCTNFQQASRLAWYYINSKVLCPYFGSFQTDYRAYSLEVGDVIKIDSLLMGLNGYLVKVTSVSDDGSGIFTVNWRNYDERCYSDTLGSQEPRVLVSNLSDIYVIPEDVKNFNVVQSQNYFNFVWLRNSNVLDTYEIRYGESWENGTTIGKYISTTSFSWEIPTTGLYKFWIKAFNNYYYSKNPTLDIYNVNSIPKTNEVLKFDILKELNGEFDNTYAYHHKIKLKVNDVLWHTTENTWGNDDYYQNMGYWGADVKNIGSYTSQIYDIGGVLACIVAFETQYITITEQQQVLCKWQYSDDAETWSDWTICNIGEYTFRYCRFRVTLIADHNEPITFNKFRVSVDVPDKEIEMDVEIPESGSLKIYYNFINRPSIIGCVNDSIEAYIIVPDETKTNTEAIIQAVKNDGTKIGAKVNLRLKGY